MLPDVQNEESEIKTHINKVGVKNIVVPITIFNASSKKVNTIANIDLLCSLDKKYKGVSMSRFLGIINKARKKISLDIVEEILDETKSKLESNDSYVKIDFTYFIEKKSPVTNLQGISHVPCKFEGQNINNENKIFLTVTSYYTSCCPCSKKISNYGAHNQRSKATIKVELIDFVDIETLVNIIERASSCEIFPILKRVDEKYVTEKAYNNPMFVEDIVRNISKQLELLLDKHINDYIVKVEHFESIHQHNAIAEKNANRLL